MPLFQKSVQKPAQQKPVQQAPVQPVQVEPPQPGKIKVMFCSVLPKQTRYMEDKYTTSEVIINQIAKNKKNAISIIKEKLNNSTIIDPVSRVYLSSYIKTSSGVSLGYYIDANYYEFIDSQKSPEENFHVFRSAGVFKSLEGFGISILL